MTVCLVLIFFDAAQHVKSALITLLIKSSSSRFGFILKRAVCDLALLELFNSLQLVIF